MMRWGVGDGEILPNARIGPRSEIRVSQAEAFEDCLSSLAIDKILDVLEFALLANEVNRLHCFLASRRTSLIRLPAMDSDMAAQK